MHISCDSKHKYWGLRLPNWYIYQRDLPMPVMRPHLYHLLRVSHKLHDLHRSPQPRLRKLHLQFKSVHEPYFRRVFVPIVQHYLHDLLGRVRIRLYFMYRAFDYQRDYLHLFSQYVC